MGHLTMQMRDIPLKGVACLPLPLPLHSPSLPHLLHCFRFVCCLLFVAPNVPWYVSVCVCVVLSTLVQPEHVRLPVMLSSPQLPACLPLHLLLLLPLVTYRYFGRQSLLPFCVCVRVCVCLFWTLSPNRKKKPPYAYATSC